MNFKKLLVVAVAGAFAVPFAAQVSAAGDNLILAQSGTSAVGNGPTGGTPSPQSAGEPKAPTAGSSTGSTSTRSSKRASRGPADFSAMDTNGDGMISRSEWDAAHRGAAASGGSTAAPAAPAGAAAAPAARGKTGTTAGPGEASPRTAPSSDTATSPSTSGAGKAGSGQ
jgi:EF hand domain-containing protein